MKYCVLALLVSAAYAVPSEQNVDIDAAQYYMNSPYMFQQGGYGNFPMYGGYGNYGQMKPQQQMDFPVYDNGPLNPKKYLDMEDDDFPVDYSLPCSNTCGCQQTCMIIWWQPCTCRCPPSCGCQGCTWGCCGNRCCKAATTTSTTTTTTTTTTPEPITTTTALPSNPGPEPIPPNNCNGGSCCNTCSCSPCRMPIFWMCPPPCSGGCCGGSNPCCNSGNQSCCNSGNQGNSCCNSSNQSCCGK